MKRRPSIPFNAMFRHPPGGLQPADTGPGREVLAPAPGPVPDPERVEGALKLARAS